MVTLKKLRHILGKSLKELQQNKCQFHFSPDTAFKYFEMFFSRERDRRGTTARWRRGGRGWRLILKISSSATSPTRCHASQVQALRSHLSHNTWWCDLCFDSAHDWGSGWAVAWKKAMRLWKWILTSVLCLHTVIPHCIFFKLNTTVTTNFTAGCHRVAVSDETSVLEFEGMSPISHEASPLTFKGGRLVRIKDKMFFSFRYDTNVIEKNMLLDCYEKACFAVRWAPLVLFF